MHLELSISNEPRVLPSVEAFLHTTLLQLPLPGDGSEQLGQLVTAAVVDTIEKAYPPGEEGMIKLTIRETAGKLEIRVRDFGIPQDVKALEKQWGADSSVVARLHGSHTTDVVDQMHWLSFGPQGKALQLIKWLHTVNIADTSAAKDLARVAADVPLAPEQQYAVRRMLPEEAVQISQLMYRTYGNTYFNQDVYYPDRIASQNLHDVLLSVVAVGEDGRLAGHCALERNQEGPVAEIGQAAVDPAHRSRGLLDRMKSTLEKEAQALGLVGWFADAVSVHIFTQQSNAHHGGHVCGVDLAVSPKSEAFRNIAGVQPQRVSCVVYFHWLESPKPRTIFVPSRHGKSLRQSTRICNAQLGSANRRRRRKITARSLLSLKGEAGWRRFAPSNWGRTVRWRFAMPPGSWSRSRGRRWSSLNCRLRKRHRRKFAKRSRPTASASPASVPISCPLATC